MLSYDAASKSCSLLYNDGGRDAAVPLDDIVTSPVAGEYVGPPLALRGRERQAEREREREKHREGERERERETSLIYPREVARKASLCTVWTVLVCWCALVSRYTRGGVVYRVCWRSWTSKAIPRRYYCVDMRGRHALPRNIKK